MGKVAATTSRGLYLTILNGLQRVVIANAASKGKLLAEKFSRQISESPLVVDYSYSCLVSTLARCGLAFGLF